MPGLFFRRNRAAAVLMAAVLAVPMCSMFGDGAFASEQAAEEAEESPDDKVRICCYVWADEEMYLTAAADAFNALNSSIYVEVKTLDNNQYEDKLTKVLDSENSGGADLIGTKSLSDILTFAREGKVKDISEDVRTASSEGKLDLTSFGSMFNDIKYNGSYYGLPTRSTCWELYYNKTLFDEAGLPYPEQMTWDEYAELAKKLTHGEGEDKVYGGYWVMWVPQFLAIQHGSYLTDDNLFYTRRSIELLNRLYNEDGSHPDYDNMYSTEDTSNDPYLRFEEGKVAMLPQGEWMANMLIADNADIDWDIAPMPVDEGVPAGTTWGQYQYMSVTEASAHPDEAFEFLAFLCGKTGAGVYAQNGIIPAYTDPSIEKIYLDAVGKESANLFFSARRYVEQPAVIGYAEVSQALQECAVEYLEGDRTLDEAMEEFDRRRREILKEQ